MARPEEADPRWIVTDLGRSGQNVNAWHWVERDCLPWAKDRLSQLLADQLCLNIPQAQCKLKSVITSGYATINCRKRKLFAVYDLALTIEWEASLLDDNGMPTATTTKGKFEVPELCSEDDQFEINLEGVSSTSSSPEKAKLRDLVFSQGRAFIHKQLLAFVAEINAGGPFPHPDEEQPTTPASASSSSSSSSSAAFGSNGNLESFAGKTQQPAKDTGSKGPTAASVPSGTGSISITEKFHADCRTIFECLIDENRVRAYTQSNASIPREVGKPFSMFNGVVSGEIVEIVPDEKLVYKWRFNDWADGALSIVTIKLTSFNDGECKLVLSQTGIPKTNKSGQSGVLERAERGWRDNIFNRIKAVFGFGLVSGSLF